MTSPRRVASVQELDPAVALREGTFDATVLLLLWCARRAFFPLLWLGLTSATVAIGVIGRDPGGLEARVEELQASGDWLGALLSPLVGVIIAFALRIAVAGLSFAAAYPLSRWNTPSDYAEGRRSGSRLRLWRDRLYLTRAYRALRWTWAVRRVAVDRLGPTGGRLARCDAILRWGGIAAFALFVVTTIAAGAIAAN